MDHAFKRGHPGPAEQQEILTNAGSKILGKAPNGWERIICTRSALIEATNSLVEIEFTNGEKSAHRLRAMDDDPGPTFATAKAFTNDLEYFPRDPEYLPDRLNEKLREEAGGTAAG
ncbi:hypothetical protein PWG71_21220 [Nocardiopsis sp. N85]|uniref:hypothetical protein n=1 Tax=Nocardiopsis sp. N85 TaxID=3029400 RepID=UPI00237F62EF|nr:hypothetical protein [Nocardiopsis sp. N85]MDE3723920.1 hypothetical protein [Nocardiopsis sp. N85]